MISKWWLTLNSDVNDDSDDIVVTPNNCFKYCWYHWETVVRDIFMSKQSFIMDRL